MKRKEKEMNQEELDIVIERSEKYWNGEPEGEIAKLNGAVMIGLDMRAANMRDADMSDANIRDAYMSGTDMSWANMSGTDMRSAYMSGANMHGTNMSWADICGAYINDADMKGTNIDYSCWPLWCGSLRAQIDERIARQLLYHVLSAVSHSKNCSEEFKAALLTETNVTVANGFHHVKGCGYLKVYRGCQY